MTNKVYIITNNTDMRGNLFCKVLRGRGCRSLECDSMYNVVKLLFHNVTF